MVRVALILARAAVVAAWVVACGGNAALRAAQEARYQGDRSELLEIVNETVQADYEVVDIDIETGRIITRDRWYEEDGTFESKARVESKRMQDRSIVLRYEVTLRYDGPVYMVAVTPVAAQIRSGYSALFPLSPGDAATPGWLVGKTEKLVLAIDHALAPHRVGAGR